MAFYHIQCPYLGTKIYVPGTYNGTFENPSFTNIENKQISILNTIINEKSILKV